MQRTREQRLDRLVELFLKIEEAERRGKALNADKYFVSKQLLKRVCPFHIGDIVLLGNGSKYVEIAPHHLKLSKIFKVFSLGEMSALTAFGQKLRKAINGISMSKKKQEEVELAMRNLVNLFKSNLPFLADQFDGYMEKQEAESHAEREASIANTLMQMGLEGLNDLVRQKALEQAPLEAEAKELP